MNDMKRLKLLILLMAAIGLGTILWIHHTLVRMQEEHIQSHIREHMEIDYGVIRRELGRCTEALQVIRGLYESCRPISRREFHSLASSIIQRHPGIRSLEWIPRVSRGERAAHEASARREGVTQYAVTRHNQKGEPEPDIEREEYFPVNYIVPLQGSEAIRGFNLASDPRLLEALDKARSSGKSSATGVIALKKHEKGFLLFLPVYEQGRQGDPDALCGFIAGTYRIEPLVMNVLPRDGDDEEMEFWIHDATTQPHGELMHHIPRGGTFGKETYDYRVAFAVADRSWQLTARPSERFVLRHRHLNPNLFLGFSLAGLALLTVLLIFYCRQLEKITRVKRELDNTRCMAKMGSWRADLQNGTVSLSGALKAAYGIGDDSLPLSRESLLEKVHPDDREMVLRAIEKALDDGELHTFESRFLSGPDDQKVVRIQIQAERDGKGKAAALIGISQDITEEWKRKKALRFNENYLRVIFDTEPDILVTTYGEKIDRGNIRMLEFTGYATLEAFAKEHSCICDFFVEREGFLQRDMKGVNWLEYIYAHPKRLHRAIMRKEGVEHIFAVTANRLPLDEKNRSLVVLRDVTQIITAQEALRKSEKQYRRIVETATEGVWTLDAEGVTTFVNARMAEILGYRPEAMVGQHLFAFMHEAAKQDAKVLLEHRESGISEKHEFRFRHKNGNDVWTEIATNPLFDDRQNYAGALGMVTDITGKKKMEAELRQKEEMMLAQSRQAAMGDMIAMIAHQWRQPITVISMAANNLQLALELEEEIGRERLEKLTTTVTEQTQHLSQTIDDFRNFFKPNREKERVRLIDVVEKTMKIVGKSLENNNIEVAVENQSDTGVMLYPNELLQVFLNLIGNAKDVLKENTVEKANITITLREDEQSVVASVCDNGGGIPEAVFHRIGEPYFTTKADGGTGLGVYMSKTIVTQHLGGVLSWENKGDGACFKIMLPKMGPFKEMP